MHMKITKTSLLCALALGFILSSSNLSFANDTASSSSASTATSEVSAQQSSTVGLDNVDSELAESDTGSDSIYEFKASIGTGFEYNDNINDDANDRVTAFMTHIRPSFSFARLGGRITANINYAGDYTFYLGEKSEPEYIHNIDATVSAEIIQNLFFLDISENMSQVYDNVTKGEFQEGDSLDDAQNRNTFTISPYLSLRPSERANITLGYTFTDTRYSPAQNSKTPSFLSLNGEQYDFSYNVNQSHTGHIKLNYELSERASMYTGGSVTRIIYEDDEETNTTRYNFYVGGSYAFSENLKASLEMGPTYSTDDANNSSLSPYVQASLNYNIGRSSFSLSYNTSFEDDPESGDVVHKSSYSFNWRKQYERTRLQVGMAYNTFDTEFGDEASSTSDSEQGNTISPIVSLDYELTPRLSTFIKYNGNIYENHKLGEHTHSGSYGLKYQLSDSSTIGLSHRISYTIPYEEDAYINNQVMLDFSYTF